MTNNVLQNEIFEIVFDKLIDNANIKFNSFRDEKVAKNVNIAIIANIVFDVDFANSFRNEIKDANFFDENVIISFSNFVCCCNFVLRICFFCFVERNFWYKRSHKI